MEASSSESILDGKTCLLTGGTSGIGAVTARELAKLGARVLIVGRNPERCKQTVQAIGSRTGRHDAVEAIVADLSVQNEVRKAAQETLDRTHRLDVLINNAGAIFADRQLTTDGLERTFALNHLAYFLMTQQLLDRLKASAPSRIINVSSEAHRSVKAIDWDNLQGKHRYNGLQAYGLSKLANLLFTIELAHQLEGSGVTANALHPGLVRTRFFEGNGWLGWVMRRFAGLFAITPEDGAKTPVYLASSPEVSGISGQYFIRCQSVEPSPLAKDAEAARRLWQISEELTHRAVST